MHFVDNVHFLIYQNFKPNIWTGINMVIGKNAFLHGSKLGPNYYIGFVALKKGALVVNSHLY
jgi:hypothetical protein